MCLSISVVLIPARANKKAKTAPAGPAPEIIILDDVVLRIAPHSYAVIYLGVLQRVKKGIKICARIVIRKAIRYIGVGLPRVFGDHR